MSYLREMADQGYRMDAIDSFHRHMVPWLLGHHGYAKDAAIVDIGAGQGHGLIPLHDCGWTNLTAVDIDDYNFETFEKRFGFRTLLCNVAKEPIRLSDDSVDAILAFHLIEHLPDRDRFLSECQRVLRPGGSLFLVTPDWRKQYKTFWQDPTHLHPFDKVSIARLLRMHQLEPSVHSWSARFGLGRLRAYRWWPRLGMIGEDILAVGRKR